MGIPAQTFQLNRSRKMIGQNISHVMLFADKVDKNDRFAIITTGEKEIVVLSAIFPMRFQLAVPTKLQKKIYLVVDNIIVASFPDSFPDQLYKEALIQALEDGYKS